MWQSQMLGREFAESLINKPLSQSVSVETRDGFVWKSDNYIHQGTRGDLRNKDVLKKL